MRAHGINVMKVAAVIVFVANGLFAKALGYDAVGFQLTPEARFWLTEAVEGTALLLLFLPRPTEKSILPRG